LSQPAVWNTDEESSINGSFKTLGKNYQLMGYLSVMQDGDISGIIETNNKLYKVKANSIDVGETDIDDEKYNSIKNRLINSTSNSIFNSWIQYMRKNVELIDIRHKSI
jgi:hypothetical protein